MNWILACGLMFVCSTGTYLTMRKLSLLKVQTAFINLGMFLVPLILFLPLGLQKIDDFFLLPINF